MTRAPTPEGDHYQELAAPGYERIALHLVDRNARHRSNAEAISFYVPDGGAGVTHVALFDRDGLLCFYGRLMSTRQRDVPPREFEFRPYALSVIRLRPEDAGRPLTAA